MADPKPDPKATETQEPVATGDGGMVSKSRSTAQHDFNGYRIRWTRLTGCEVVQFLYPPGQPLKYPDKEHETPGYGPTMMLLFGSLYMGRKNFAVNLSGFTIEELDAFERIVTRAIHDARPICATRDKIAEEMSDANNETTHVEPRVYRAVPHEVDRVGKKSEYPASLQVGPDGTLL